VDGGREGARLVGAPPSGRFEDGFSGVVELPGLDLELGSLLIEEGVEGLGEGLGWGRLLPEEAEALDPDRPPVGLLGIEPLIEEPAAVAKEEVLGEGGGLDGGFDIGLGCK